MSEPVLTEQLQRRRKLPQKVKKGKKLVGWCPRGLILWGWTGLLLIAVLELASQDEERMVRRVEVEGAGRLERVVWLWMRSAVRGG